MYLRYIYFEGVYLGFRKSEVYALDVYALKKCGKFEVNRFGSLLILHAVLKDMISRKNTFKIWGSTCPEQLFEYFCTLKCNI